MVKLLVLNLMLLISFKKFLKIYYYLWKLYYYLVYRKHTLFLALLLTYYQLFQFSSYYWHLYGKLQLDLDNLILSL